MIGFGRNGFIDYSFQFHKLYCVWQDTVLNKDILHATLDFDGQLTKLWFGATRIERILDFLRSFREWIMADNEHDRSFNANPQDINIIPVINNPSSSVHDSSLISSTDGI